RPRRALERGRGALPRADRVPAQARRRRGPHRCGPMALPTPAAVSRAPGPYAARLRGFLARTALRAAWLAVAAWAGAAAGEERIVNVSQGTNIAVALFPDGESLVVDLLGRLWRLPTSGGGATQLTPDDEAARL